MEIALALWMGASLGGCALLPEKKRAVVRATAVEEPARVGTVVLVNAGAGFVLVDTSGGRVPTPGAALKTYLGEEETGALRASAERRKDFVAADIVEGMPARGDAVFRAPGGEP